MFCWETLHYVIYIILSANLYWRATGSKHLHLQTSGPDDQQQHQIQRQWLHAMQRKSSMPGVIQILHFYIHLGNIPYSSFFGAGGWTLQFPFFC